MSTPNWGIINGVRYMVNERSETPYKHTPDKHTSVKPLTIEEVKKWTDVPTYIPVVSPSGLITFKLKTIKK
jgi:hypothetical protein